MHILAKIIITINVQVYIVEIVSKQTISTGTHALGYHVFAIGPTGAI